MLIVGTNVFLFLPGLLIQKVLVPFCHLGLKVIIRSFKIDDLL